MAWIRVSDIHEHEPQLAKRTAYREAKRLGLVVFVEGRMCIREEDVKKLLKAKRRVGNPVWIADSDAAAEACLRANEVKSDRLAKEGPTKAERRRNRMLAKVARMRVRR
jgi:hypothetical protein